jgi:GntR family negative regulator for fad regulon and positive regulator of fabA
MQTWEQLQRPAEAAESRLVDAILDGTFAINSTLPGERDLCTLLGVTRPTLREALQRLARVGWVEIHQGRPTRVRDYWREGGLGVLSAIAQDTGHLPGNFVHNLLAVRIALAPVYAAEAVSHAPGEVIALLSKEGDLPEDPVAFSEFDWQLHHALTVVSGNPIYTLILNGFRDLYRLMGPRYFANPTARNASRRYYQDLLAAFQQGSADAAANITLAVMRASLALWSRE